MCLAKKCEWLFDLLQAESTVLFGGKRLRIGIEKNLSGERRPLRRLRIFHGELL